MVRILIGAGVILAVLTGFAAAQNPMMPGISLQGEKRKLTPEEIERQQATDDAYKATIKKIPEKKPVDPWGNIRSAPAASAQNK